MQTDNYIETILVSQLCTHYQTDTVFFEKLQEYGLITLVLDNNEPAIHLGRIGEVEKYIHLHYDLNINMEGLDAISHLLQKTSELKAEVDWLKNRLRQYEAI